jgi:hypothetical protein
MKKLMLMRKTKPPSVKSPLWSFFFYMGPYVVRLAPEGATVGIAYDPNDDSDTYIMKWRRGKEFVPDEIWRELCAVQAINKFRRRRGQSQLTVERARALESAQ